jgi:hypothetical protein
MVFNATFNNISAKSWRSGFFLVGETGVSEVIRVKKKKKKKEKPLG